MRKGAAYVPHAQGDLTLRTQRALAQASPYVLVTDASPDEPSPLSEYAAAEIVQDPHQTLDDEPDRPPDPEASAMVIFTSGSTGMPKRMALSRAEIIDAVLHHRCYEPIRNDTKAIHLGASLIAFPVLVIRPFIGSGAAVLPPEDATMSDFIDAMREHDCKHIQGYTGFLQLMAQHQDAQGLLGQVRAMNTYGDVMNWNDLANR